ncbi:hypothetical protein ACOBQX_15975 [Actinokineospora sp. G85]|uniref:hypothetical protein n=1 Tax=Actinokineospora sp. G85 TaxID=3406626 RepID=UPI003C709D3E
MSVPPRLTKPSGLPDEHQWLIDLLWQFHVAADGPTARKVATVIAEDEQRAATANHETVRRIMKGIYLPEWRTIEVVFLALCKIADVDPDDQDDDQWGEVLTHRELLRRSWQQARFGTDAGAVKTRAQRATERTRVLAADPWAAAPPRGLPDEPPF